MRRTKVRAWILRRLLVHPKTRIFYTSPWMIARQTARFPCWYKQNPATVKPESADSDGTPAALLTT